MFQSENPASSTCALDTEALAAEIRRALHATMFTSTLRIAPRRLNQIAQESAAAVERFFAERSTAAARAEGQHLAREGFGYQAVLSLVQTIHAACWASDDADTKELAITGSYAFPLLEGYMTEREALLLQEQERTRRALERARSNAAPNDA